MSFSINHCTCGHHPQLKLLESNLWIVKCGHCKQFAEPWITELGAISRWNRAQVDRVCLGCKSLPKAKDGLWLVGIAFIRQAPT